jgi:predicted PurR-regulated permease PerM
MFVLAILIFLFLITSMQDIAIMFFASFVIACSLNPVVNKLSSKMTRQQASSLTLFGVLFILGLFFVPIIVLSGHEIKVFAVSFPEYLENIKTFLQNSKIIGQSDIASFDIAGIISTASGVTSTLVNEIVDFSKNIGTTFVYLLVSFIVIYYLLADKELLKETYAHMFPKTMRRKALDVLNIISKKVGGYMVGTIAAIASVGIIMTIGLLILGVDYAVLLGLITALLDIIPIVGPAAALIICLVVAYKSGAFVLLMITVVFAVAQIVENNLVKPYVFGKLLDIHPILIYLFLFITAKYLGVVGVVFAPAIAATVCVLIQELYMKNIE